MCHGYTPKNILSSIFVEQKHKICAYLIEVYELKLQKAGIKNLFITTQSHKFVSSYDCLELNFSKHFLSTLLVRNFFSQ